MVELAQLVRAPGCGPGGRGFESLISPQIEIGKLRFADFFIFERKGGEALAKERLSQLTYIQTITLDAHVKIHWLAVLF